MVTTGFLYTGHRYRCVPRRTPELLEGPILKGLLLLSWPIIASTILEAAYNLIDTFWLGKVSDTALAAPSVTWSVIFLFMSIGMGVGIAGTALVSQYKGSKQEKMVSISAGQVTFLMIILALAIGIIGFFATDLIIDAINPPDEVKGPAGQYLSIIFLGLPFMFGFFVFNQLMQGWGDTITPLKITAVSIGINLILDPMLIFGVGAFPELGVEGAAIATVMARAMSCTIGFILLFAGKTGITVKIEHIKPRLDWIKRIIKVGLPASVSRAGPAMGFVVLVSVVASFGTAAIDSYGIGVRIISIALHPVMGISMGTAAMVGQNLGAGNKERAEKVVRTSAGISFIIMAICGTVLALFSNQVVRAFIDDQEIMDLSRDMFFIIALSLPFFGMFLAIEGAFRGSGHTIPPMVLGVARLWVFRVPLAYYLAVNLNWGPNGIWWALSLSNIISLIILFLWFQRGTWKHAIIEKEEVEEKMPRP